MKVRCVETPTILELSQSKGLGDHWCYVKINRVDYSHVSVIGELDGKILAELLQSVVGVHRLPPCLPPPPLTGRVQPMKCHVTFSDWGHSQQLFTCILNVFHLNKRAGQGVWQADDLETAQQQEPATPPYYTLPHLISVGLLFLGTDIVSRSSLE